MGDLLKHQVFVRMGPHTDTSARTGAADWLTAGSHFDLPVSQDGYKFGGDVSQQPVPTEHRDRGLKYQVQDKRNQAAKNLTVPLHPSQAAFVLNLPVAETAAGLPAYHQARQFFGANVLTGSGIGRQATGIAFKTLALSFDRSAPAAIIPNLTGFMNRDSEMTATALAITGATNASPIVLTVASGHVVVAGDVVVVASVGGNTAANGTWVVSAVTSTTITLQGTTGNGAYTSGGTCTLTQPTTTLAAADFPTNTQGPYVSTSTYVDVDFTDTLTALAISGATAANPVVLTHTSSTTAFQVGDVVTVTGVVGTIGAVLNNLNFIVTARTDTTVTLNGANGTGLAYTSGGQVRLVARWTGDNTDLKSFGVNFDNGATVDIFRPNAIADLNLTWTKLYVGDPSLTMDLKFIFAQTAYLNYHRIAAIKKFRARLMGVGPAPSGSTTTTNSEVAGTSVTVEVPSTTGFAVNDYVLFNDSTNNKQCVGKVTTVNAGVSLVIDTMDVAIAAGSTVQNTAWEIKILTADMTSAPDLGNEGEVKGVSINGTATLLAGATSLLTVKAYNDDGV